jgi:flavin reductase (DIM6/NTAB) family NADH-FMN oxidoreductase RutF
MQIEVPYEETRTTLYPEPVHIVIVKNGMGGYNPMSAAWVMFTSIEPRMLAVSIGYERYTFELFQHVEDFVIAIPSIKMAEEVKHFGSASGRDLDKLATLGTRTQAASQIDNILLSEATANYECKRTGTLETGDHVIFAGEVVASHRHRDQLPRLFSVAPRSFGGVDPSSS